MPKETSAPTNNREFKETSPFTNKREPIDTSEVTYNRLFKEASPETYKEELLGIIIPALAVNTDVHVILLVFPPEFTVILLVARFPMIDLATIKFPPIQTSPATNKREFIDTSFSNDEFLKTYKLPFTLTSEPTNNREFMDTSPANIELFATYKLAPMDASAVTNKREFKDKSLTTEVI